MKIDINIRKVKINRAIKVNKEQTRSICVEIKYNFCGNNYTIFKNVNEISNAYGNIYPVKEQILETIHENNAITGKEIAICIIFYKMVTNNRSNEKFIDLIYNSEKEIITKTYIIKKVGPDNTLIIKDITNNSNDISIKEQIF